jgi:hypothetical protein
MQLFFKPLAKLFQVLLSNMAYADDDESLAEAEVTLSLWVVLCFLVILDSICCNSLFTWHQFIVAGR